MKVRSFYMHFPYCIKKCNYCDFYRTVNSNSGFEQYHQLLNDSWIKHQRLLDQYVCEIGDLDTFYIGGGTPSLWGKNGATYLNNFFHEKAIKFSSNYEFTIEINPGTDFIRDFFHWKNIGVNRYSVGIQSLDQKYLEILGRVHTKSEALSLMEKLASENENYSIDFILGLPYSLEHQRDICLELSEAMKYRPSHISMYILNVDKNYIHYDAIPDEDWIASEYIIASDFLKQNGYEHYEVSNWAIDKKQSKHNQNYWKPGSWISLGPSATGNLIVDDNYVRYLWKQNEPSYELEHLDKKSIRLEKLFLHLRTNQGLEPHIFFNDDERVIFDRLVKKWNDNNYLMKNNTMISLSDKGFLVLDSLVSEVLSNIKTI